MADEKAPERAGELYLNDCTEKVLKIELGKVEQYLRALPGWKLVREGGVDFIEREFKFDTFDEAGLFQQEFTATVRKQKHDPEEGVRVIKAGDRESAVPLRFRTHSVRGISFNDLIMAAKANHLLEEMRKKG